VNAIESAERRLADRVPFAARVMIVHMQSAWFAELIDLSEGGCAALRPAGWELEAETLVRLFFYDGDGPAVVVPARVARIDGERMGFEYHEPQNVPPTRA
jgi:hypothetical protein